MSERPATELLRRVASFLIDVAYLAVSLVTVRLAPARAGVPLIIGLVAVYLVYSLVPAVILYFRAKRSGAGEPGS